MYTASTKLLLGMVFIYQCQSEQPKSMTLRTKKRKKGTFSQLAVHRVLTRNGLPLEPPCLYILINPLEINHFRSQQFKSYSSDFYSTNFSATWAVCHIEQVLLQPSRESSRGISGVDSVGFSLKEFA